MPGLIAQGQRRETAFSPTSTSGPIEERVDARVLLTGLVDFPDRQRGRAKGLGRVPLLGLSGLTNLHRMANTPAPRHFHGASRPVLMPSLRRELRSTVVGWLRSGSIARRDNRC